MAPLSVLYTYAPTPITGKVVGTHDTPIVIMSKNVAFSPQIPKKYGKKEFEDFVAYLTACLLHYALVDVVDPSLLQHVCEVYYTSAYYGTRVIVGTI